MTALDKISIALCAWKENRGGALPGMQSVINVIMNRAAKTGHSPYAVVYAPLQFSSMSYQHDPQLLLQPEENDIMWPSAQDLAQQAANNNLQDITNGATSYYAMSMTVAPSWAKAMQRTAIIAGQIFFK